jgi:hypothetical protein
MAMIAGDLAPERPHGRGHPTANALANRGLQA